MCDTENYLIHSGLKRGFFFHYRLTSNANGSPPNFISITLSLSSVFLSSPTSFYVISDIYCFLIAVLLHTHTLPPSLSLSLSLSLSFLLFSYLACSFTRSLWQYTFASDQVLAFLTIIRHLKHRLFQFKSRKCY